MTEQIIIFENSDIVPKVLGDFDRNLETIEKEFDVTLVSRGPELKISGMQQNVKEAADVVNFLKKTAKLSENITEQNLNYAISMVKSAKTQELMDFDGDGEDSAEGDPDDEALDIQILETDDE